MDQKDLGKIHNITILFRVLKVKAGRLTNSTMKKKVRIKFVLMMLGTAITKNVSYTFLILLELVINKVFLFT